MRLALLALAALLCSAAHADTVCINGRCSLLRPQRVVVHSDAPTSVVVSTPRSVTVVSADAHAAHLASTNTFSHCNRRGGGYEGLGFSTTSPDHACRSACFWGTRRVREIGTAWCPARRGWIAVVRYE
jgi:hypothetical protein